MLGQSISVSEPNDEWLRAQVANGEHASKSEVINDLIRQARRRQFEVERIRFELIQAEQSGFTFTDGSRTIYWPTSRSAARCALIRSRKKPAPI